MIKLTANSQGAQMGERHHGGVLSDCNHILREVNIQTLEIGREWQYVQDRKGALIEFHTVLYIEFSKLY